MKGRHIISRLLFGARLLGEAVSECAVSRPAGGVGVLLGRFRRPEPGSAFLVRHAEPLHVRKFDPTGFLYNSIFAARARIWVLVVDGNASASWAAATW